MEQRAWFGYLDRKDLKDDYVARCDAIADAGRAGRWEDLLRLLDTADPGANLWRVGGKSWFTPLHHAAWHGAPTEVVEEVVARGAWRTLPSARGETPHDVAARRGHHQLLSVLEPALRRRMPQDRIAALDAHLDQVVRSRIDFLQVRLRPVVTAVLTEMKEPTLWFPVPGMYGGFSIELRPGYLGVSSWSRVVGGSGQRHVITHEGATLVEHGFV
jgi:hypothetical protein